MVLPAWLSLSFEGDEGGWPKDIKVSTAGCALLSCVIYRRDILEIPGWTCKLGCLVYSRPGKYTQTLHEPAQSDSWRAPLSVCWSSAPQCLSICKYFLFWLFHNACLSQMVLHQRACQIASKTCVCVLFLASSSHKVIFHVSGYSSVSSVSEFCLATQHNDEIKNSAVEGKSEGEVSNDAHDRAEPEIANNTI